MAAPVSRILFRTARRMVGFFWILVRAAADFVINLWLRGKASSFKARSEWLQRWSAQILRCVNVQVSRLGELPKEGVLACNHLSYLDVMVLAAGQPMVFVAKSEVRGWPLIGWLTRFAGTLYVQRERKSDVARLAASFTPVVNEGVVIGLFPEGTSTGGHQVLPFYSSLFEPAARSGWRATPAWIGYTLADGSVEDEICYWRDMKFALHLPRLLSKERIVATVAYGPALAAGLNRKEMARLLHAQVCQLGDRVRKAEGLGPLGNHFIAGVELTEGMGGQQASVVTPG
jgi:1-acyl-sn-glycerol-3-phosphate acyltransferase